MVACTSVRFRATEAGFADGLGGASNRDGSGEEHYVLFGIQNDDQHPDNSGVYFEWDDQDNGAVDCVRSVSVTREKAVFTLTNGRTILVESGVSAGDWARFVAGIEEVFGARPDR